MTEAGFLDRAGTIGRKRFARAVSESPSARARRPQLLPHLRQPLAGRRRPTRRRSPATRSARRSAAAARPRRRPRRARLPDRRHRLTRRRPRLPANAGGQRGSVAQLFDADLAGASTLLARTTATSPPGTTPRWRGWSAPNTRSPRTVARAASGCRTSTGSAPCGVTFDRLDSTFGGAHARDALVQYLRTELPRLLRAAATTTVRRSAVLRRR